VVTTTDSEKRLSTDAKVVNIYSLKENRALAINCKPELSQETSIPLGYSVGASGVGTVKIVATNITGFLPTYNVVLEDLLTTQSYDLRLVDFVEISVAAGTTNDRLVLHLTPPAIIVNPAPSIGGVSTEDANRLNTESQSISIKSVNNKARVEISSVNAINATIDLYTVTGERISRTKTTSAITEVNLPDVTQIYILHVVNGDMVKSEKVMK
jgi:hypothetical protein